MGSQVQARSVGTEGGAKKILLIHCIGGVFCFFVFPLFHITLLDLACSLANYLQIFWAPLASPD